MFLMQGRVQRDNRDDQIRKPWDFVEDLTGDKRYLYGSWLPSAIGLVSVEVNSFPPFSL